MNAFKVRVSECRTSPGLEPCHSGKKCALPTFRPQLYRDSSGELARAESECKETTTEAKLFRPKGTLKAGQLNL